MRRGPSFLQDSGVRDRTRNRNKCPGPASLFPDPNSLFPIPYSLFAGLDRFQHISYSVIPWLVFRRSCQQGVWPACGNSETEQGTSAEPR
jgi:hypothetical protein